MRGVIQEPLQAPEAVGTSHVVSIKPEGTLQPTGEVAGESQLSPTIVKSSPGKVTQYGTSAPSGSGVNMSPSTSTTSTTPKIAPTIMPSTSKIGGIIQNPKVNEAPIKTTTQGSTASAIGSPVAYPTIGPIPTPKTLQAPYIPTPTPTPSPQQTQQQYQAPSLGTILSVLGGGGWQGLKKIFGW
jgi:hypothetical protein